MEPAPQCGTAVDLNVDAGESFGPWRMGNDEAVFPLVSTVNVACGFHAGDPSTMVDALRLAKRLGLAVGAHPGLPDRVGFGRRAMAVSPREVHDDVLYQIGALAALARGVGVQLSHAKMHGALWSPVGDEPEIAEAIVRAVNDFDPELPLFVNPRSELDGAAGRAGHPVVREGFPERGYLADGHLAPRRLDGAVIDDPAVAARRALQMATEGTVTAVDGTTLHLAPETLCIHGDNPAAFEIATEVRSALTSAGIAIRAV